MSGTTNPSAPTVLHVERRHQAILFRERPDLLAEEQSPATVCYPINYDEVYNLKGRLLTLVDATIADPEQRKAQKGLVWQTVRSWMEDIVSAAGYDAFDPPAAS